MAKMLEESACAMPQGDEVHALRDECAHAELALSDGEVTGKGIECFLHGSCFDLRTGALSWHMANVLWHIARL
jgi:3-phenylpropionate/trans-cinnamate dioxygenase ferredoxin subunit